jgi:hypothetical protein
VLLALTREHFPVIARFHPARISFGDVAPADHYLLVLVGPETVDEKQSNCQQGD